MENKFENILNNANKIACDVGANKVETEHLFYGILCEKNAKICKIL